ncbi:MAG: thioesterase [Gammaproteobacteria bacterium RIFCSPHIGHO2_12_FULL_42_10]|nr:MAG: thioesterase [Gammaproteobacteria bacterium RIFCSPHIGHO2_12_FULL_42_10]
MQAQLFSYPLLIKENHLDAFCHVNNAMYLTLFEEARWDIVTKNGYGLKQILEIGLAPTILEVNLRFLKEVRLREQVVIQTQVLSYRGKVGKLEHKMLRQDVLCCSAELTIGLFSLKDRKMVSPTAEWLKAIGMKKDDMITVFPPS